MRPRSAWEGRAGSPADFERLTVGQLQGDRSAEAAAGLPNGATAPGQPLAAFTAAARLGLPSRPVHVVDWLFRFTRP